MEGADADAMAAALAVLAELEDSTPSAEGELEPRCTARKDCRQARFGREHASQV